MMIKDWIGSDLRIALLERAHSDGVEAGDHRVSFCLIIDADKRAVLDVVAIPPCSVRRYEDGIGRVFRASTVAFDFHCGQWDGEAGGPEQKASVRHHISRIFGGFAVDGHLIEQILWARRSAFVAADKGWVWDGRAASFPPRDEG